MITERIAGRHHVRCRHRAYHLTCDEFDQLYGDGRCHICRRHEEEIEGAHHQALHIDHIGRGVPGWKVRGLLCNSCNYRIAFNQHFSDQAVTYFANAYWLKLAAAIPTEPAGTFASFRWRQVWQMQRAGLWSAVTHPTRARQSIEWAQVCDRYGPPLAIDMDRETVYRYCRD